MRRSPNPQRSLCLRQTDEVLIVIKKDGLGPSLSTANTDQCTLNENSGVSTAYDAAMLNTTRRWRAQYKAA